MLFQPAGNNSIFIDGDFHSSVNSSQLTHTWAFQKDLEGLPIEYAYLYCEGKTLDEVCPEDLLNEWTNIKKLHKSYEKSFKEGKVPTKEHNFYKLLPESFSKKYFRIKNEITKYVFDNFIKPENYEYLVKLEQLIAKIASKSMNVDHKALETKIYDDRVLKLRNKIKIGNQFIKYKTFGSITGRLTTKKHSFPILTLDKKFRQFVKPNNDWFLELDYNAAEIRTFLALNKQSQPEEDIHVWHTSLYGMEDRDAAKVKFFAWFYNGDNFLSSGITDIDKAYSKHKVLAEYWNGNQICNPYKRIIKSDERHALSYLIQSTTWDIFSRMAILIDEYLTNNCPNSFVSIMLHDSVVIDLRNKDYKHIENLKKIFANTDFGNFRVNSKIGKNLGDMEKI